MDSNDIRSHFEARALAVSDDEWSVRELELRYICEAIAQAHEEECRACARRSQEAILPCGHHASNAVVDEDGKARCEMCELKAQVAVMRRAIESVPEWDKPYTDGVCVFCGNVMMDGHREDCPRQLALSAAPKVLAKSEGRWRIEDNRPVLTLHQLEPIRLATVMHGDYSEWDGEPVDIYICQGGPEQPQSSEQSGVVALQADCKAQEPDGEEGYKRARGVVPWQEGDELPEDVIARVRGRPNESAEETTDEN